MVDDKTYGLAKRAPGGYTGARGYHPLLAVAAGTGDVLMARLREGRANTARGAAHFLRETVSRVRWGPAVQLTMRAISTPWRAAGWMSAGITIRQHKSLHNLIEAIPEVGRRFLTGYGRCGRNPYTPFQRGRMPRRYGSSSGG